MEIALSIAALIIAIAFAVLVIYLAQTLKSTQRTLDNVANTLEGFEKQLNGITTETTELIKRTNLISYDYQTNCENLNTVFSVVIVIENTYLDFYESLFNISSTITNAATKNQVRVSVAVKSSIVNLNIFKNRQK